MRRGQEGIQGKKARYKYTECNSEMKHKKEKKHKTALDEEKISKNVLERRQVARKRYQ